MTVSLFSMWKNTECTAFCFLCCPCDLSVAPLSPGTFAVILAAGSYSQSDESRNHPEAAGTQLWSNREHQQFPQPVCAAAHKCQVDSSPLSVPAHNKGYFCSRLIAWLLLYESVLPLVTALLSFSFVLPSLPVLTCRLILSSPHPFFLFPFHCHSHILVSVNPPALCSEVTLPSQEESVLLSGWHPLYL